MHISSRFSSNVCLNSDANRNYDDSRHTQLSLLTRCGSVVKQAKMSVRLPPAIPRTMPWVWGHGFPAGGVHASTTSMANPYTSGVGQLGVAKLSYHCDDALLARVTGIVGDADVAASVCETYDCTTGK